MNTNELLHTRYATKKFNKEKTVSDEDLNYILEAGNLTPTSYGLQPFSIVVVTNQEHKDALLKHAYNQMQITDCSHILVLAASTKVDEEFISNYVANMETTRSLAPGSLEEYKKVMVGDITNRTPEERVNWAQKQAYIALGSMMIAAIERGVDSCPMEGFSAQDFDEVLGLGEDNLHATVVLPIGYRSDEDETQNYKKVRRELDDIVVKK